MIPPFVQQVIGVVVRAAVVFCAGWLAAHGGPTYTDDQLAKAVTEIVPVVAVLAWSIYQKYRGRQKLLTAQAVGHAISEDHVEMIVSSGAAPSVRTLKGDSPILTPVSPPPSKEN